MRAAITVIVASLAAGACSVGKGGQSAAAGATADRAEAERCQKAADLREAGYLALTELKLSAARRAYSQSLELDPDNHGALHQLAVIDALAYDRQIVGTSASNDHVYGDKRSPCEKYAALKLEASRPRPGKVRAPTVQQSGQIVSYAKGTAKPQELLSPREIQDAMGAGMFDMVQCYKRGVERSPLLRGELVLHVKVLPNGAVDEVEVQQTTLDEQKVETCVANIAQSLRFPKRKSRAIMSIIYPLLFGSSDDEQLMAAVEASVESRSLR